ncbi:MAG: HEAT repeat domain-containing protein [Calditrichae bacterium]|nr:HEAT repeat domain-containing protein [Calditrichota bacterium]MCB9057576.1 HEAT repeat domain-containing protein [Calditrichia bacterium]
MKKLGYILVLLISLSSFAFSNVNEKVDWSLFSNNLEKSLKSENLGVRLSAMQMIIRYSDKIDVSKGVYDVMREFRNNDDQNVRKLALITLYKMQNDWAIDFLKRQYRFEDNSDIKNKIERIVVAYDNNDQQKIANVVNETLLSIALK